MTRHKQRPDQPRPGHQNPAGGRTSLQHRGESTVNTRSHRLLMAARALGGIKGSFKVSGWKYFRIFAAALLQEKWNEQRLYRGGRQPEQRWGRPAVATLARYLLASSRGY